MSGELEGRYRQALSWYPKRWRDINEDVVIGTLLDVAQERDERTPSKSDLRSLRLHGLAAHFAFLGRILTPAIRDRVAAIALGTGFGLSAWAILFSLTNAPSIERTATLFLGGPATTFGPFASLGIILYGIWALAFVVALIGRPWLLRFLLVATLPAALVARILSDRLHMGLYPTSTMVIVLELLAALALLGTARPTARWRLWIGVSAATIIAAVALILHNAHVLPNIDGDFLFERSFFMETGAFSVLCGAGAIVAILCVALHRWTWAAVTAISTLPWFALYCSQDPGDFAAWAFIAALIAIIVGALAMHTDGVRLRITITRD